MRAHRVRIRISENQEVRLQLPGDFPQGDAEVIVLEAAHEASAPPRKRTLDELLAGRLAGRR